MVAITRAIGRKAAMEMLVTGREFPAIEAKELGLINRVVVPAELETETNKLAHEIAQASGFALSIGKQGFYAQADMTEWLDGAGYTDIEVVTVNKRKGFSRWVHTATSLLAA